MLSVEHLSKTVRDVPLFSEVGFGLDRGEHVGVVGRNGTGKSTLLKVLCGIVPADGGTVSMAKDSDVAYLPQAVAFAPDATVDTFLFEGSGERIRSRNAYAAHQDPARGALVDALDGWHLEEDYHAVLGELGISDFGQRMATLSGGQVKKTALARIAASRANLLLLDEPTNHLDIATIEWLEKRLSASKATILVVTHDRYFLDTFATSILELDQGTVYVHPGSFQAYLERKAVRLEDQQKEQKRIASILRRELDWLGHGAKARTTKQQGRIEHIRALQDQVRKVGADPARQFSSESRRLGKRILLLDDIAKGYGGRTLVSHFTYDFLPGDRIGLVGPNGSGKSTLMDIITSRTAPDTGTVVKGANTVFSYYDQNVRGLPADRTIIDYATGWAERIRLSKDEIVSPARFLELFGFPPVMQRTRIGLLSGGEQRRLYLICKLLVNPNFLLLDEPTNDLDLETMENLEQYLRDFSGCALIVSHDRAFLDQTCSKLFVLGTEGDGTVLSFPGCYSDYELWQAEQGKAPQEKKEGAQEPARERVHSGRKGLSFKEKAEFSRLEHDIAALEAEQKRLEESFATAEATALGTLAERSARYEANKPKLEAMEERWMELGEKAEEA